MRDWAEYAAVWPVLKLLEWLPMPAARLLSGALARIAQRAVPRWRRVAERNLSLALPGIDERRRGEIIRGVYENLGRVLLALAKTPRLSPGNIRRWIDYEGFEHYEAALAQGRGVLFLTAHLGNWELSATAHALLGHPMHVMIRPLDNPLLDGLLDRRRRACGNQTIAKQQSVRPVLQALRRNEAVGVLIDQNTAGEGGIFADFFGIPAASTSGLAKIARRTGAAVIPGFALWRPRERRYVLKFYPPLEMVSTADEERDLKENTQRCQTAIEEVIREHPEQWLWIHRRWKTRPPGEPPLY